MSLNISYLEIAPILFTLSRGVTTNKSYATGLLKKYSVIPPVVEPLQLDITLSEINQSTISWELHIKQLTKELNQLIGTNNPLTPEQSNDLFDRVRKAVEIVLINGDFPTGIQLLNDYALVAPFISQAKNDNKLLEFSLYMFCLNLYHLVWFNDDSLDRDSQKVLYNIYKKAEFYYGKNTALLNSPESPQETEVSFFNLLRIFRLTLLFKNMEFEEFYTEFLEITKEEDILDMLVKELPYLKSKILTMLSVVLVFVQPFSELSLVNHADVIIDLFTLDEESFEYQLYTSVLVPLSEGTSVIELIHSKRFARQFRAEIGFAVPQSKTYSFEKYLSIVIDIKNVIILLSLTKSIPRLKFISLLGYDVEKLNEEELNEIHTSIILLISSLGLGKIGLGYNIAHESYYSKKVDHGFDLEGFSNEVQSEGYASIVKSILIEKFQSN